MSESVSTERKGSVAWVTIDRPEVRNALDVETCALLTKHLRMLGEDRSVRAVVLRGGGGRVFVSGADVREFRTELATPDRALQYDSRAEEMSATIEQIPQPVIAMIAGYAIGTGCTLALACDLRIANASAKLGLPVGRLGLLITMPDTARLVALVGPASAKRLLMTGELVSAEKALSIGLVDDVVEDRNLETATAMLAETIAGNAPLSLRAAKQMVARCARDGGRALRDGAPWYRDIFASQDFREGVDAFLAKRKPRFIGA